MKLKLLTVYDVAERLGLSHQRIRQFIAQGRLPAEKVGRDWVITENDLERADLSDPRQRYNKPPASDTMMIKSAAKVLGVTRQRVYELMRDGRLERVDVEGTRYVYVTRASVERLAEEREHATGRRTPRPKGAPVPEERKAT